MPTKVCLVKAMVFPVWLESWVPKNWFFWTVVLEKILESALDCKEIQPVHPKGNQFSLFIGRTGAEAETPIFWPPEAKSWVIAKDPGGRKSWRQKEKGWHKTRWSDNIADSMDINLNKFLEIVNDRRAWHAAVHGVTNNHIQLRDWTTVLISHSIPPPHLLRQLSLDMILERQVGRQKFTMPGTFWLSN